jgi:hypothetical protein
VFLIRKESVFLLSNKTREKPRPIKQARFHDDEQRNACPRHLGIEIDTKTESGSVASAWHRRPIYRPLPQGSKIAEDASGSLHRAGENGLIGCGATSPARQKCKSSRIPMLGCVFGLVWFHVVDAEFITISFFGKTIGRPYWLSCRNYEVD